MDPSSSIPTGCLYEIEETTRLVSTIVQKFTPFELVENDELKS